MKISLFLSVASLSFVTACNPSGTPASFSASVPTFGAINPKVTQANIDSTVCVKGYTHTIRPSVNYTESLKKKQVSKLADKVLNHYEEDHFIPLEIGGNPTSERNLWPEPIADAHMKDKIENSYRSKVCSHAISLANAQAYFVNTYSKYVTH